MMDTAAANKAATMLIAARRSRQWLDRLPEDCRPASIGDALAIQAATVAQLGERIAGWKVGGVIEEHVSHGVLLGSQVMQSPGHVTAADVPLLGMEAEIAFRFLADAPPRENPYTYAEVAERVVAFPAIEVVATRYRSYAETPLIERVADCMSNGAFVAGAERADWRSFDLLNITASLWLGDDRFVEKAGGHVAGDPLKPAVDLVNELRTGSGVIAGQVMTTGTYTGLNFAMPGQRVRAEFANFGAVEIDVLG
jgi:2-keto-4-pentenoate hydratase